MDVLDEVIEFLYGGAVDPREMRDLISKMTDASDVHVQAPIKVKRTKAEQQKLQAQVGLASNIVGLTAGGAALVSASKDERFKSGGKIARSKLDEIAEIKMKDLNANDLEQATKIIEGSARSMGLEVTEG